MTQQPRGLEIFDGRRSIRLKWHRLRRNLADPLFSAPIMLDGFALGASMELDFRVRGDHGFVALHDDILDRETTGHGPVDRVSAADLRALRVRPGDHPPILSEDIAGLAAGAHPDALLQLDMKDGLDAIGANGVDHLRTYFADAAGSIIVSARDLALIVAVRKAMPDVGRGIDPTAALTQILRYEGGQAAEARLRADILGPTEPDTVYLAWELVLAGAREGLDLIGIVHDLGRTVDAWTFNLANPGNGFSPAEAENFTRLVALRPDQITTDEPDATERAWIGLSAASADQSKIGSGIT